MAENVLKLKKRAVSLGMSKDEAREAGRKVLEAFIADAENGGKSKSSKPAKKAVKKAVAKKKKSENKKATKPAKAAKPKSTKQAKPKKVKASKQADGIGRATIGEIDWKVESDDWNPRKGSPVEALFKALKRAKGNVDKAFDAIVGDMYDYVGRKKRDGTKRTKAEAEAMLRYRLNRTKYEYATRTGQHEQATDRVEYGSGQYAKPKRGRPKKSENKRQPARKVSSAKKGGTRKRKAGSKK